MRIQFVITIPFNWINVVGNKVGNKALTDNREKIIIEIL